MIPDQLLRLADGQAINGTATTVYTNVVDLDTVRDVGSGETLYVRVRFDTLYTQAASGGANILLAYGDDASLSNAANLALVPLTNTTIPAAGSVFYIPIPPIAKTRLTIPGSTKKYLGVAWQIYGVGATIANGTWTVDIVTDINMAEHTYSVGFTVK